MGYLNDVDRWLDELLAELPAERLAEAKTEIKAKILASYRNGQGVSPAQGKPRAGMSRRTRRQA